MVNLICVFDRIGGITGQRIHIRRLLTIGKSEHYKLTERVNLGFASQKDVMKVSVAPDDLDKFVSLMNKQGEFRINRYDDSLVPLDAYLGIVQFNRGVVDKLGLFTVKHLIQVLDDIDGFEWSLLDNDHLFRINVANELISFEKLIGEENAVA